MTCRLRRYDYCARVLIGTKLSLTFVQQRLAKEIKVWASLDHGNVLPLAGFYTVENNKLPRLISEWMDYGTMTEYMRTIPRCGSETQKLVRVATYFHGSSPLRK